MQHNTSYLVTKHKVTLSEGEVKMAVIRYLAERRPHMCPLELASDAQAVLDAEGGEGFTMTFEQEETRYGPPNTMDNIVVVEFTRSQV